MTKRRKILVGVALAAGIAVFSLLMVLHHPRVQRWGWERVTARVAESTGFLVEAHSVRMRLVPARLELENLEVRSQGQTLLATEEIQAAWGWRALVSTPHRVESLSMAGVVIDTGAFQPTGNDEGATPAPDLWGSFEIGSLQVKRGRAVARAVDVDGAVGGLEIRGGLNDQKAIVALTADSLTLDRHGRILEVGPLTLEAQASAEGLDLTHFEAGGRTVGLTVTGRVVTRPELEGEIPIHIEAELESAVAWWDPNMATGLSPEGRIELDGVVMLAPEEDLSLVVRHRGAPFSVAGYEVETLDISVTDGRPSLTAGGATWGETEVTLGDDGSAVIDARLLGARMDPVLRYVAPQVAAVLGEPVTLTGQVEATVSFPVAPNTLAGRVDVEARWPDGRIVIQGEGTGAGWQINRFRALAAGLEVEGNGAIREDASIRAAVALDVRDPGFTMAALARWAPELRAFGVSGGPAAASAIVGGSLEEPIFTVEATWSTPRIGGRSFDHLRVNGEGGLSELRWDAILAVIGDARFEAGGRASPVTREIEGTWTADAPELAELIGVIVSNQEFGLDGDLSAEGDFRWADGHYRVGGHARSTGLSHPAGTVSAASLDFDMTPGGIRMDRLSATLLGGEIEASVGLTPVSTDGAISGRVVWRDLDPGHVVTELPEIMWGRTSGEVILSGTVARPTGELAVDWEAVGRPAMVEELHGRAWLEDGILSADAEAVTLGAGTVILVAEAPLGGLNRPSWLWPEAPVGNAIAEMRVTDFHSAPITDLLEIDDLDVDLAADLVISGAWDLKQNEIQTLEVRAGDVRVLHPTGELVADGPVDIRLDGDSVRVQPVVLTGFDSRIEFEADYDRAGRGVHGRLSSVISEGLTRLLPLPFRVQGPFSVDAEVQLPAGADSDLESLRGSFTVDHGDGLIVMRDPPLEVRGLRVSGGIEGSTIEIHDGAAEVNRGDVVVGGGWDPKTGQGVVLELDDVMLFTAGILSQWDGELAIEPRVDGLARVVGNLTLVAGLWDETFDLASAFLSSGGFELAADDPLHQVSLDVAVRGRSGIRVNNNLGRFDVSWDVLRVDGTAASPRLRGSLRIAQGGVLALGGQEVRVRRGALEFTGDPSIDPIVEIVPESDLMLIGGDEDSANWDPTLMATRGLAQSLSSALGFENETLRPAEIAVETERDPSVNFMVGQRLHRNLALFLTTNLTDVQDRTSMLQGWNFRGVPGLVVQLYQETVDDNLGAKLLQRFSWGGPQELKRPEIHRLRLEGEWPMPKRFLRRTTNLRRGQPYDPFLLFVASVRMERVLAGQGFQRARVTAFQEGDSSSPTLVFYCDPGTPQPVIFEGDQPSRSVRGEVTAMYRPPPLEESSLVAMKTVLTQYLALEGHHDARVSVERQDDLIVVLVDEGREIILHGPYFEGLPEEIASDLGPMVGSARVIAAMSRSPERVRETVEQRLASLGFFDADILAVDLVRIDDENSEVRIRVDPGPRQVIHSFRLEGADPLGLAEPPIFDVAAGHPLDRHVVDNATRALRDAYLSAGYMDASARSEFYRDEDGRWLVETTLEPGSRRRLRNVEFTGLRHSSAKVLKKGMTVDAGEIVSDLDVDRSASRIANFSPVERVDVHTRDVGVSEMDLEFDVVEKSRWAADLGGGWSTERGASASFGLRDENLFGRGIGLNLRGGWGSTEKNLFLIGSLPPVPGGRLSLITTVGYRDGNAPDEPDLLQQQEKLASLEAQYALASGLQVGLYYRWTDTRTFEKDPDPFFPLDIRLRQGIVGTRAVMDRFDFLFDPRKGYGLTTDLGWSSSAFGSDLDYLSWLSNFTLALTPFKGTTWLQTVRFGVAEPLKGQELVRDARFFAGGQASIRGFDLNSVGPTTWGIDGTLVPAGGGALFVLNEELRIPIRGPIRAAVFADIGQVWESWSTADTAVSVGVGVGVRWSTPIGPLWADVAWPVANVGISSKRAKFYLGIGRPF